MSNFSGRGYITLSDLDNISDQISNLSSTLGDVTSTVSSINGQSKDFVFYRNDHAGTDGGKLVQDGGVALTFAQTGIEAIAAVCNIKDQGFITIDFKQDWKTPPVVTATIDGSNDQYACQIDFVTKTKVRVRFMKIKTVSKPTAGWDSVKQEAVNIIAIGITRN